MSAQPYGSSICRTNAKTLQVTQESVWFHIVSLWFTQPVECPRILQYDFKVFYQEALDTSYWTCLCQPVILYVSYTWLAAHKFAFTSNKSRIILRFPALSFYILGKGSKVITLASVWGVGTPRMKARTSNTTTFNTLRIWVDIIRRLCVITRNVLFTNEVSCHEWLD